MDNSVNTEYAFSPINNNKSNIQNNYEEKPEEMKSFSKDELTTIWELEVWKKAEQTKFKAYLKQLELEYMNKISDEYTLKENEREKQVKALTTDLQILQTKLKKKALELEARENKVNLMEEELRIKINEVARQLANKEEEINFIKKRNREEKMMLEKDKLQVTKQLNEKNKELEDTEKAFKIYRKDIDDSPVSVLRGEINKKCMELDELTKDKDRVTGDRDKYKTQSEKLKIDMIKLRKITEQDKENMFKNKMDEIEKLRFEIYNQKMSQNDMTELVDLRNKLKNGGASGGDSKNATSGFNNTNRIEDKKEYKMKRSFNSKKNEQPKTELEKLTIERANLLGSGAYSENDPLIQHLDKQLKILLEQN